MNVDLTTEEGRIDAAKEAGRNIAAYEIRSGYTEPRNWDKDDAHNARVFSHLAAVGFTRLGTRSYSQTFVDAYRAEFIRLRLEYLRGEIEAERISGYEIAELAGLAEHIDSADVLLLQWAGVPEHADDSESNEEHQIYWDTEDPDEHMPFGPDTARIIDLDAGGAIAYCHKDNAHRIVMALRAAE